MLYMRRAARGTVVPNGENPPKISSPKVISRVFPYTFLQIYITSVSGCLRFTFKICQIVAGSSMIRQFHGFLKSHFWQAFAIWPNFAWPGGGHVRLNTRKKITGNYFFMGISYLPLVEVVVAAEGCLFSCHFLPLFYPLKGFY